MKILWNIVLVILAFAAGSTLMMAIESINYVFWPPPQGVTYEDAEAFKKYVAGLPQLAFVVVWVSHFTGPLLAVFLAARFAAYRSLIPACIVGVLYITAGVAVNIMIQHSRLFTIVDLPLYPIAMGLGIWLGKQKPAPAIAANTP